MFFFVAKFVCIAADNNCLTLFKIQAWNYREVGEVAQGHISQSL